MPQWIHDRAEHILAKNPSMEKSTAFAVATQQAHRLGKSPKGYGTAAGRLEAKKKYDGPRKGYTKTPNPGKLESPKMAGVRLLVLQKAAEYGGPGPHMLPRDHTPGVVTPMGGSSCANCKYAESRDDGPHCTNKMYQKWAGTSELIDPSTKKRVMNADTYCSDWWEPKARTKTAAGELKGKYNDPAKVVVDTTVEGAGAVKRLLERIDEVGRVGHSFSIVEEDPPDGKRVSLGGWDGDGGCRIHNVTLKPGTPKEKSASVYSVALDKLAAGFGYKPLWRAQAGFTPAGFMTPAQRLKKSMNMGKFDTNKGLKPLEFKMAGVEQMSLHPKPTTRSVKAEAPNSAFRVKAGGEREDAEFGDESMAGQDSGKLGFAVSQYSGPLNPERFKYHSYLPPFAAPPVKTAGPPSEKKKTAASPTTPAGRLANTQAIGKPKFTAPPGPSISDIAKPKGFGTKLPGTTKSAFAACLEKQALIERLVRLGATPIPGTPKLFMKSRTPQELKALQNSVEQGWNARVTNPLMRLAEKGIGKLPSKAQPIARKGARVVAEDPVGMLAANLVPAPGASAGYLALKRGGERLIDKMMPLPA